MCPASRVLLDRANLGRRASVQRTGSGTVCLRQPRFPNLLCLASVKPCQPLGPCAARAATALYKTRLTPLCFHPLCKVSQRPVPSAWHLTLPGSWAWTLCFTTPNVKFLFQDRRLDRLSTSQHILSQDAGSSLCRIQATLASHGRLAADLATEAEPCIFPCSMSLRLCSHTRFDFPLHLLPMI